jgi:uncharacterized protein involved in exopolysaccharide biosynthesis
MEENLRFLKPFIRGFLLIVLSMIIAVIVAKKYLSYIVPLYESTTKLKLADVNQGVQSSNLFKDFDVFASANKIAAEIEVLKSTVLINKTLDSLNFDIEIYRKGKLKSVELFEDSPFIIEGNFNDSKGFDKKYRLEITSEKDFEIYLPESEQVLVKGSFGKLVSFQYGQIKIILNEKFIATKPELNIIDQYEFEFLSRQKLIRKISTNLDIVSVDKDVAVVRINYKSPVPAKAAKLVNRLAKTYIQDYIEAKYKAAETTVEFLDNQLIEASKKLSDAESNIERYRNEKKITNIRQETETDLRKIAQLKIQQTNVKMNLIAIQSLNKYIKNGKDKFLELAPNFEAFTDLLSTELIKKLKALQSEKKDLLLTYTTEEGRVKVIDEKIKDLTEYLTESISNTAKNLEIKYKNLSDDIKKFEQVFITVPEKEKIITLMNREFEIYQKIYISLNEKRIEARIAKAAKISFHRIISPAEPSKFPTSPNRPIILIVSALMGLFGSILLIHLVHLAKAKVNDRHTVESKSGISIAMTTPKLKTDQDVKNHFLQKAGQLEMKELIKEKGVVCLSSFKIEEGSLFNAIHLADAMSNQGRKVLFLDVSGVVKNNELDKGSVRAIKENLDYMELTDPVFQRFTKVKMDHFIADLKESYNVILILNNELYRQNSLLMMSVATINLVAIDSRLTHSKKIVEVDLIKEEYNFSSIHFILNRYDYNPSIFKELLISLKKIFPYNQKTIYHIGKSQLERNKLQS